MNKCFFSAIKFFESIDSTNSELLNNEYEDKTLIYTYDQTKGRGRFDRKWITFKNKALALSFLLKNNGTEKNRFNLLKNYFIFNMIFSITLVEILDKNYKIKSWIKWPNDIYIEDKKLAGILTESKFLDKNNFKIVAGIGININVEEDQLKDLDKKVCSIYSETGFKININDFTNLFIDELSSNLSSFFHQVYNKPESNSLKMKIQSIKKKWINYSNIIEKQIMVCNMGKDNENSFLKGKVVDIDDEGFLIIETEDKKIKLISGDVSVI